MEQNTEQDERVLASRAADKVYHDKRVAWMNAHKECLKHHNAPDYLAKFRAAQSAMDEAAKAKDKFKVNCNHSFRGKSIFIRYDSAPDMMYCEVCKVAWNAVAVAKYFSETT